MDNVIMDLGRRLGQTNPTGRAKMSWREFAAIAGASEIEGGHYVADALTRQGLIHGQVAASTRMELGRRGGMSIATSQVNIGLTIEGWDRFNWLRDHGHVSGLAPRWIEAGGATVPAADRVVTINDNSPEYRRVAEKIGELSEAIRGSNEFESAEGKEQQLAEVEAGGRLLRARRVRLAAITAFLIPALLWLSEQFAGGVIGELASELITALKALLGL